MRCALPICLCERWRHQPTGWPRSMPMARSRPSAVFADPGDDRLSGPEKTSVFRATRLDSLVRRRGRGIRPPPSVQGNVTGHYRASPVSTGRRAVRGEPCPLPCPGSRAEGTHSHRGVHSAVLFDCFPAAVPSDGAPAAGASRKGERSQAEETRASALRCRVFRSLVENGRFWRLGFFLFLPHANGAQRAAAVDPASPSGHYVEAPAAAFFPLPARREFPKSRLGAALC